MQGNLNELWDELTPMKGSCPSIAPADIKRRVNTALNSDPKERKLYMRQKVLSAVVLAAVLALLMGSALAAATHWSLLEHFFEGDLSSVQSLVDNEPRSASDETLTLTVESSASDGASAYLLVTVTAHNSEALEQLETEYMTGLSHGYGSVFAYRCLGTPAEDGTVPVLDIRKGSVLSEVPERRTECSRTWSLRLQISEDTATLLLWLTAMGEEYAIALPLSPAEHVTVEIHASGTGYAGNQLQAGTITVERVTLSPFHCLIDVTREDDTRPVLFFAMADGTVLTANQLMDPAASDSGHFQYQFRAVQDLEQIAGVILFGTEYPLDGGVPFEVETDGLPQPLHLSLHPSLTDDMTPYSVGVGELCQALGADWYWDKRTGTALCTYRGMSIALTAGSATAQVNGVPVTLDNAPAVQDGILTADFSLFAQYWHLSFDLARESDFRTLIAELDPADEHFNELVKSITANNGCLCWNVLM